MISPVSKLMSIVCNHFCAFYDDPSNFKTSRVSPKLVGDRDSTTQEAGKQIKRCESGEDSCFTIWSYDGENNTETMTIIKQGCFRFKPEDGLCSREVCQSSSPYKILAPTRGPNSAAASEICAITTYQTLTRVSHWQRILSLQLPAICL